MSEVRNPNAFDFIPEKLLGKLKREAIDSYWTWVVYDDGEAKGALFAAPCHGTAMVVRVAGSGAYILTLLLRQFVRDIEERGITGIVTMLDPDRDIEVKLLRFMRIAGATEETKTMVIAGVPLEKARGW